ncbi:MAG: hypothetical protein HQL64_12935 [Magnetococcales bacterium]|nr:hypothetical protein [Magnetococcales bacterium]
MTHTLPSDEKSISSARRSALRLLFILTAGSTPLPDPDESGATLIFRGEKRLHALDFWVRYPDYLADELLECYKKNGDHTLLDEVCIILTEEEPDLRRIPMLRWRFGAYDNLDTALSHLSSRRLVRQRKHQTGDKVQEYDFLLFPKAVELASQISDEFPQLAWYVRRAERVVWLAGNRSGNALKERQHQRFEYHATPMGQNIPPIKDKVWAMFRELTEAAA